MEFVSFHRAGLAEMRRLLRSMPPADRLTVWSEVKLLNEFGEGFVALFEIEPGLVELVVDGVDPPVAVVFARLEHGRFHAVAVYHRQGGARELALERARERSNT